MSTLGHDGESAMKHGRSATNGQKWDRTYTSWLGAKQRCTNPRHPSFTHYGGRGISMCSRWAKSFENFLSDMGDRPPNTSLDRWPDPNGDYEPGNCRWATRVQQNSNTSRNRLIQFNGELLTMSEVARRLSLNPSTVAHRIDNSIPLVPARFKNYWRKEL